MADINKFHRSKERITELLSQLNQGQTKDDGIETYITDLQKSISIIDHKMEEFQKTKGLNPGS